MALDEAGLEDSAILLMSLGEEEAAAVVQAPLAARGAKPGRDDRANDVGAEGPPRQACWPSSRHSPRAAAPLVADTGSYVRNVLRKALDEDKANLLIDRILQNGDISGIEGLKWMDAASIGEMLRHEHPQIVAAVLVHLDTDQASAVLKTFAERQRNEVLVRIATLDGIQPSALKDLSEVMGRMVSRRRAGAHGAARRRQDRGRDDQPDGHQRSRPPRSTTSARPTTTWRSAIMDNLFTFDDLMQASTTAASRRCSRKCSPSRWSSR